MLLNAIAGHRMFTQGTPAAARGMTRVHGGRPVVFLSLSNQ